MGFRDYTRSLKPLHRGYAPTPQAQCSTHTAGSVKYQRRRLSEAPLGASRKTQKKTENSVFEILFLTQRRYGEENRKLCVLNIVFNTEKIWSFRGNTRSLKPLHRGYAPTPQAQ